MEKVMIAMSGGVDSSAAALIMKNKGYECAGCTMKLFDARGTIGAADCSESISDDASDAKSVCDRLGMEHYVFDLRDEFREKVICAFVNRYLEGLTPNPCIECNDNMKFTRLYKKAVDMGIDHISTGHYARIIYRDGFYHLHTALDPKKDQSYVLYRLSQDQLSHTLFPLGDMNKDAVRRLAEENGFVNASKKDSQDICFVPDGDYSAVVERYGNVPIVPGDFVDLNGNVLGQHKGIIHYTIGQRKGLGISAAAPYYVVKIDVPGNRVILGSNEDLFTDSLTAVNASWTGPKAPDKPFKASVRVRYHGKNVPAEVTPAGIDSFSVKFDEPVRAITPGQAAVIYIGDEVIGGGTIIHCRD